MPPEIVQLETENLSMAQCPRCFKLVYGAYGDDPLDRHAATCNPAWRVSDNDE